MIHTFTRGTRAGTLALLSALTAVVAGWATTAAAAAAEHVPTLTNDVGQPAGGAEQQLPLGIALLAIGVLGVLAAGLLQRAR